MQKQSTGGEVATPKQFKLAAIVLFTLALLLSGCEQPNPPKTTARQEGIILLKDAGFLIHEIGTDKTVAIIKDGVVLRFNPITNTPFVLEGIAKKGDPAMMGQRFVDTLYDNGQVTRKFTVTAVASKNDQYWQEYFRAPNQEEEKPLEKNE